MTAPRAGSEEDRRTVDRLLAGVAPDGSRVVIERWLRRVLDVRLPSGERVFAKQHTFPALRVRVRYALRRSPTQHERAMLAAAAACGLRVPEVVAERTRRGLLGPRSAVLVTRALQGGVPPTPGQRLEAALVLGDRGFFHPDLHGDNVRRIDGEPAFLDFQSCRRRRLSGRDRVRMLAKVAYHLTEELDRATVRALLEDASGAEETRAVLAAMDRIAVRAAASERRHRLRTSTLVRRERLGWFGARVYRRDVTIPERFGPEQPLSHPLTGPCAAACSEDGGIVRLRRRGRLLRLWLAPRAVESEPNGILGWEREGPWPWARQALYIPGSMGGSDWMKPLDALLGRADPSPSARAGSAAVPEE